MPKGEVRARMVAGAARLLAEHGPPGASVGDVLGATGAPRGSTYHHFPGGRKELHAAALDLASARALRYFDSARGRPAAEVVDRFVAMWRALLTDTELRSGCAVLAVAVAGQDPAVVARAGEIFGSWRAHLAELLVEGGLSEVRGAGVAATVIAAMEGAVAIARAEQDLAGFEAVAAQVRGLVSPGSGPEVAEVVSAPI